MPPMSDELTSPLKAAELRDLCRQNGLSVSGKKSVLIGRLLEANVDPEDLGIIFEEARESENEILDDDEAFYLNSDDEEAITSISQTSIIEAEIIDAEVVDAEVINAEVIDEEIAKTMKHKPIASIDQTSIVEAEMIDTEVVEDNPEESAKMSKIFQDDLSSSASSLSEEDQSALPPIPGSKRKVISRNGTKPKTALVLALIILVGGVGYWYFTGSIDPFTPDTIRYGDDMRYSISDGIVSAEGEFIDAIVEKMDTDDDICKIIIEYGGLGNVGVTKGGSSELFDQSSNYLSGAIRQSGSYGFEWLTVEKQHEYTFEDVTITRHLKSVIDQSKCSDIGASSFGNSLDVGSTTWTEIRDQDVLRSQVDYSLTHESGAIEGTATSFGVSGIFSSVEDIQSAIGMAVSPVELKELIGDQLIQESSTGNRMGWSWSVLGTEEVLGELTWRILMVNEDVKSLCLGHAYINIWVNADSPWAIYQEVDIRLSGDSQERNDCSSTSQLINNLVVPEGSFEMRMSMSKKELQRGESPVVFGRDYDNRVRSSQVKPLDSELTDWQDGEQHIADNSTSRTHPLEDAVACIPYLDGASGAKAAMSDDGYVWRAIDNRTNSQQTTWNLSWVDTGDTSGWVEMTVSGSPSSENCSFLNSGVIEDGPNHDRSSLPQTLSLSAMENRLLDSNRYSELSTGDSYLGTSSGLHSEVMYRHLVASTSTGLDGISDWLNLEDGASAATVDLSRSWDEGQWSNNFNLAADLSDGRVVGWSLVKSV
ncbi:MAG: hypothetical protein HOC79_03765 [Euryarchaeota archaeon]|nr:hypothetical protein [Euryarchaeota archaeon]MBT4406971.1 hypothetical protein [Euryarchaeota archaeon]